MNGSNLTKYWFFNKRLSTHINKFWIYDIILQLTKFIFWHPLFGICTLFVKCSWKWWARRMVWYTVFLCLMYLLLLFLVRYICQAPVTSCTAVVILERLELHWLHSFVNGSMIQNVYIDLSFSSGIDEWIGQNVWINCYLSPDTGMGETVTCSVLFSYRYLTVLVVSKDVDHYAESHSYVPIASKLFPIPYNYVIQPLFWWSFPFFRCHHDPFLLWVLLLWTNYCH